MDDGEGFGVVEDVREEGRGGGRGRLLDEGCCTCDGVDGEGFGGDRSRGEERLKEDRWRKRVGEKAGDRDSRKRCQICETEGEWSVQMLVRQKRS